MPHIDYGYGSDIAPTSIARWSYHLARPPDPRMAQDHDFGDWAKANIYDRPELDPNATVQSYVNDYRRTAADLGVRADETDANVLYSIYLLDTGRTTWKEIAGSAGSAPTASGEAPLLDVIAQQQAQAIDSYRTQIVSAGGEADASDAAILANLESLGVQTYQLPASAALDLSAVYALPPEPAREEAESRNIGGVTRPSEYSGLSSFRGFGPDGSYLTAPTGASVAAPMPVSTSMDRNTLIVLAIIAVGAFLLMRGQSS